MPTALRCGKNDMLVITVHVNCPAWQAQGVKEQIAMELEKHGDVRVVSIVEDPQKKRWQQMSIRC